MGEGFPKSGQCPQCGALLRIRDRRFVGATFPCPDCQTSLTLVELQEETALLQKASDLPTPALMSAKRVSVRTPSDTADRSRKPSPFFSHRWILLKEWLASPLVISWLVASVAAAGLCYVALRSGSRGSAITTRISVPCPETPPVPSLTNSPSTEAPRVHPGDSSPETTVSPAGAKLVALGRRLTQFEQQQGIFPPGAWPVEQPVVEARWSWLAALERTGAVPLREADVQRPWDSPSVERFVRRQISDFTQPDLLPLVGEDGYPTTHFAGSAGVGIDGPQLPASHPRAGLFGAGPRTTADVRDGLSQTIAVYGIETKLGSWAAAGPATVRSLTAEPYVRGPDGLGTGNAEEMEVLMADGSVKRISRHTDPQLVRRMATISEGVPLEGIPPAKTNAPTPSVIERPLASNPPDDPPVSALETGLMQILAVTRPDPEIVLKHSLQQFQLSTPTPRREVLVVIEDLLGRPVVWTPEELGSAAVKLDENLSFTLQNATVQQLIDRVFENSGLVYRIEPDQIRLQPAAAQ